MEEDIRHTGIVEQVDGERVRVLIAQTSACASCHAAKMCMASESKDKHIDAIARGEMHVGDEVEVIIRERAGWLAVLIAYVVPFVLLVVSVAVLGHVGLSDAWAGTCAIGIVGVYMVVLRLLRGKIERQFTFEVEKKQ